MMLTLYFLVPFAVLWFAHRKWPTLGFTRSLVLCAISTAVGCSLLYLTFSSGIPFFTFGYREVSDNSREELLRQNIGWMLRYVSETFGWLISILWFWVVWLLMYVYRKVRQRMLAPAVQEISSKRRDTRRTQ